MRSIELKKEIAEYYNSGNSFTETSKKFNVSSCGIITYLKLFGYKTRGIREGMKKQFIDEAFFEKIDLDIKAQILGMIYADGCLLKYKGQDTYGLQISLDSKDCYYLEKINFIIKNERKIQTYKNIDLCKNGEQHFNSRFSTNNYKIAQDIQKLGITQRKSLTCTFPTIDQVPEQFIQSFILGYFEGDGCFHISKHNTPIISICGTIEFCTSIGELAKNKLGINYSIKQKKKHKLLNINTVTMRIGGGIQTTKFLDWIYQKSSPELRLERKYNTYINFRKKYDEQNNFIKDNDWIENFKQKTNAARTKLNGKVFREFYFKSPDNKIYFSNRVNNFSEQFNLPKRQLTNVLNGYGFTCNNWIKPTDQEIKESKLNNTIINIIFDPKIQKKSEKFTNFYIQSKEGQIYLCQTLYRFLEKFSDLNKKNLRYLIKNKTKSDSGWKYPSTQEIEDAKQNNSVISL